MLQPTSTELIKGLYLPLEYWDLLVASDETRGPRGGTVLSYDTVPRYIYNSLFTALVARAWIGSRGVTTRRLVDLILDRVNARRLVTLAVGTAGP